MPPRRRGLHAMVAAQLKSRHSGRLRQRFRRPLYKRDVATAVRSAEWACDFSRLKSTTWRWWPKFHQLEPTDGLGPADRLVQNRGVDPAAAQFVRVQIYSARSLAAAAAQRARRQTPHQFAEVGLAGHRPRGSMKTENLPNSRPRDVEPAPEAARSTNPSVSKAVVTSVGDDGALALACSRGCVFTVGPHLVAPH
jgi:hypothetical protein